MKLNWGNKLMLVFLVFAGGMSFLVYKCFHTNYDLVSKEYYKDEIAYQHIIDGTNKANQLNGSISLQQYGNDLVIQLPAEMKGKTINGSVLFYYAQNAMNDRTVALKPDSDGSQVISTLTISPGNYIAKVSWNCDNQFYYSEKNILIK